MGVGDVRVSLGGSLREQSLKASARKRLRVSIVRRLVKWARLPLVLIEWRSGDWRH